MVTTVQCPGCGKSYSVAEKYAGRKVACKQCGVGMRVPAASGGGQATSRLRVACEQCGTGHFVAAEHAGKKTVCKSCGAMIPIPGGISSTLRNKPAGHPAMPMPTPEPEHAAPEALDVYGLVEEPVVPRDGGGPSATAPAPIEPASEDPPSRSLRPKAYQPLTAAQKKKIAQRADKMDRLRPSNATLGVSFGTVLAIALFGWRMHQRINGAHRFADRTNAAESAPADVDLANVDPRAAAAGADQEVRAMVAKPSTAEARDWLDPAKSTNHAVMEMSVERAREMVAGFYDRGAAKVYVLDPTSIDNTLLTAQFAVELPQDPLPRMQCFQWEAKFQEDGEPSQDLGQKYLLITTD